MTELIPENYVAPLDPIAIFGRIAPLDVDLGCGNGDLICELGRRHPERNFLGIDKLACRVAKSSRKASTLDNVRILNVESSYAVRYLLPESSVGNFYLLFPDPWPKRRHHRRRIVTRDFLDSIYRALENDGVFRIATDDQHYAEQIQSVAQNHSSFAIVDADDVDLPLTKFEGRFREQGAPIYRLALRKISPVR